MTIPLPLNFLLTPGFSDSYLRPRQSFFEREHPCTKNPASFPYESSRPSKNLPLFSHILPWNFLKPPRRQVPRLATWVFLACPSSPHFAHNWPFLPSFYAVVLRLPPTPPAKLPRAPSSNFLSPPRSPIHLRISFLPPNIAPPVLFIKRDRLAPFSAPSFPPFGLIFTDSIGRTQLSPLLT